MKKVINSPETFIDDMLKGIYLAHPKSLTYADGNLQSMIKANIKENKVGLATGGGSGHLPLFLGYIGDGLLDGCSVGEVFQSPSSDQMLSVTKAIDSGSGVLYILGNYGGDKLNYEFQAEAAEFEFSIEVDSVIVRDDVTVNDPEHRRGVAGIFFVYKCAGAAASEMLNLAEVKRIAQKSADNVRTMGMAMSPCIIPRVGRPSFELGENEMEIGMGIHGEPGVRRGKLIEAKSIVKEMITPIIDDLGLVNGDEVSVLINGLGATPLEEQYIVYRHVYETLENIGVKVFHAYVGEFATSMEMAGFSISLFKLDEELKKYLSKPATSLGFKQNQL